MRRDIDTFRLAVESHPNSAAACNDLAWAYATAPEHLRDPSRAPALAERATELKPHDPMIRNTLGVAYYRVGRYREAADILRANLASQKEQYLALDLYFLAMCHHRLGEAALAGLLHLGQSQHGVSEFVKVSGCEFRSAETEGRNPPSHRGFDPSGIRNPPSGIQSFTTSQSELTREEVRERASFRAEAETLMGK